MSKKSTSTTGPSAFAQPSITAGVNAVTSAANANAPNIAAISQLLQSNTPGVVGSTLNNPTLAAASSYDQNVLSGNAGNNPALAGQIANTNSDVANAANAAIGLRGGAGGSAQAGIIARALAKNETNLRYTDYQNQMANQNAAASNATSIAGAQNSGISALIQYLTGSATIPQSGATTEAQAIAQLLGNSTTTTQSTPALQSLTGLAGAGLAGWASGGFKGA